MTENWKIELPPKPGMYEVNFGDGVETVYLWPVKASDYDDLTMEDGINWGRSETDDPESVELACVPSHQFKWRVINTT